MDNGLSNKVFLQGKKEKKAGGGWKEERKKISHSIGNQLIPARTIHGNHPIGVLCLRYN